MDEATGGLAGYLREGGKLGDVLGLTSAELEAMYSLGHALYEQQRYSESFKVFSALVTYDHTEPRYGLALAAANRMLGRHEDALRQYLPAIMADPLDPAPLYYSAESLVEMGRGEEAIEALDTVEAMCEGQDKYAALAARARMLRGALAGPQA
ncbi:SycD/LcrH family type III secretion system chaperone [Achromobacter insuavis]